MPKQITLITAFAFAAWLNAADAATVQSSVHVESARFVDGSNITGDRPAVSLTTDVSFNNGAFIGLECYAADVQKNRGLKSGCDVYAGYFQALKNKQALTLTATRHHYSRGFNREWDYTSLEATWHASKNSSLSIAYANDWFDRPFDTIALKHKSRFKLSNALTLNLTASATVVENGAPTDLIHFAKLSLEYSTERWTIEPAINVSDSDLTDMFAFDIDQPDISLTISYRLY